MLMPKRVKHRKQFRGTMKGKLQEETRLQMVSMVFKHLSHAGSKQIRLKLPVLL